MKHHDQRVDFKMYTAHELEAQRVVPLGSLKSERAIADERKVVQGDWVYCVESEGELAQERGPYAMIVGYTGEASQVEVPSELGGLEVRELADQVFSRNRVIERAVMPDTVECVGSKTFFQCEKLASVKFSDAVDELDASTFSGCRALADLRLPASLRVLPKRLLFDCPVQTLVIPASVESIEEQAFDPSKIGGIEVEPDNAAYSSDGLALFDARGAVLMRIAVKVGDYAVPESCERVAASAFKGCTWLENVRFGQNLRSIGDFAFFRTGLISVEFPSSLREVGESAFASCASLESVQFNEGLAAIGPQAFSKSKLIEAHLPASLEVLGRKAFERTGIDFENESSFSLASGSISLKTDGKALYRTCGDGLQLVCLLVEQQRYDVLPGTVEIAEGAFEHESRLEHVELPEGLRRIGKHAFKFCTSLVYVGLPESLEDIGEEAFWDTRLASVRIGPRVREIGACAFQVAGSARRHDRRTLQSIDVDAANERYYLEESILIERAEGGDRALMFVEPRDTVVIPRSVTAICETAFFHAHVREMRFHAGIQEVDPRALLGIDELERVHVEFPEPVDGFDEVTVEFPYQARDMEDFTRPLCMDSDGLFFDFATYDSMVVHEIDPTAVVRMILARFEQPVKLGEAARAHFEAAMKGFMNAVLRRYAQECNIEGYERLARNGYLDDETRALALRIAESEQAGQAVGYLLNLAS